MTISTCRSTVSTRWFSCKQPRAECLFHLLITETPNLDTCYLTLLHLYTFSDPISDRLRPYAANPFSKDWLRELVFPLVNLWQGVFHPCSSTFHRSIADLEYDFDLCEDPGDRL